MHIPVEGVRDLDRAVRLVHSRGNLASLKYDGCFGEVERCRMRIC